VKLVLWWDEDIADDLDDSVLGDTVLNADAAETVNLDADEATVATNVNLENLVVEEGWEGVVEVSLWYVVSLVGLVHVVAVDGVAVKGGTWNDVVLKESLEVLAAVLGEEEGVDAWAELEEGKVVWCEKGAAWVVGGVELLKETSLAETELKGGELGWEEVDDLDNVWWWDQEGVNTVNDTVRTENVDSNNAAVEVQGKAPEGDLDGKSLWLWLV